MKKLLLLSALFIFTCSSGDDDNNSSDLDFTGTWSGTFSGGDNGTWNITVDTNGNATGTGYSNDFQLAFDIIGTFSSNGNVYLGFGTASTGAVLTGQANSNSANGTWINEDAELSGDWLGNKD